jgi:hypothetical protein
MAHEMIYNNHAFKMLGDRTHINQINIEFKRFIEKIGKTNV